MKCLGNYCRWIGSAQTRGLAPAPAGNWPRGRVINVPLPGSRAQPRPGLRLPPVACAQQMLWLGKDHIGSRAWFSGISSARGRNTKCAGPEGGGVLGHLLCPASLPGRHPGGSWGAEGERPTALCEREKYLSPALAGWAQGNVFITFYITLHFVPIIFNCTVC